MGCYKEKGHSTRIVPALENRVMNAYTFKNNMTIKECVNVCLKRGFKYAGLQYGNDCYCDNTYDKYGKADNCNMSCSGNKNEVCGGYWANSVYEVNGANKQ